MTHLIGISNKLNEIHMKLEPSGLTTKENEVLIIGAKPHFMVSGSSKRKAYRKNEVGVVLKGMFPDNFYFIERFGVCLPENSEQFKERMLEELHQQLVKFREGLLAMQKHLNAEFSDEVDESIQVDWNRYECVAISESSQKVSPYKEGDEMDWSSTQTILDTIYVQVEDSKTKQLFHTPGLEGLKDTGIINRLKKAIRAHEYALSETENSRSGELK